MKKGLLGSTALVAATALTAGVASAAEAPTYSISGYVNFLTYFVSQDVSPTTGGPTTVVTQDESTMFMEVNEAEFHIKASGATDNGLTYGLTMQVNANAGEGTSDETYANIGGSWGTIEFGNNDGAEDSMATGAESIMGGVGGFDGEYGAVVSTAGRAGGTGPSITGDTGDSSKITYYSPNFSGVTLGLSYTPNVNDEGQTAGVPTGAVDSIGFGAKYSGDVGGGVSLTLSGVYVTDTIPASTPANTVEEAGSWSVGGIVGFQNFQVAASYGDSGESYNAAPGGPEFSYWNVGASFEQGPLYLSAGYHVSTSDGGAGNEDELSVISLTADYALAPGLTVLAEVNLSSDSDDSAPVNDNDATTVILGAKVSF